MKVGKATIETKGSVDVTPPFHVEVGIIGFLLISYVLYKLVWGV